MCQLFYNITKLYYSYNNNVYNFVVIPNIALV